jgi:hypothetical protein
MNDVYKRQKNWYIILNGIWGELKWRLWKSRSKPSRKIKLTIRFIQAMQIEKNIFFILSYITIYLRVSCRFCDHQHGVTQEYERYNKYVHKMCNWHHLMLQFVTQTILAVMKLGI